MLMRQEYPNAKSYDLKSLNDRNGVKFKSHRIIIRNKTKSSSCNPSFRSDRVRGKPNCNSSVGLQ